MEENKVFVGSDLDSGGESIARGEDYTDFSVSPFLGKTSAAGAKKRTNETSTSIRTHSRIQAEAGRNGDRQRGTFWVFVFGVINRVGGVVATSQMSWRTCVICHKTCDAYASHMSHSEIHVIE